MFSITVFHVTLQFFKIKTINNQSFWGLSLIKYTIPLELDVLQRCSLTGFYVLELLVFSVTPFKIDQNQNQNRSIDKVQNLRKERKWICKDSRQDSGHSNFSYAKYAKKRFTQIYRDLYGDAMLVPIRMGTNMAARNQQKYLSLSFVTKAWIYLSRNSKTLK